MSFLTAWAEAGADHSQAKAIAPAAKQNSVAWERFEPKRFGPKEGAIARVTPCLSAGRPGLPRQVTAMDERGFGQKRSPVYGG